VASLLISLYRYLPIKRCQKKIKHSIILNKLFFLKVEITDIDWDTLEVLIKFIYTDTVEKKDITPELLAAADKYSIPVLFNKCELSLCSSTTAANAMNYFIIAYLHQASILKQTAMMFIIDNFAQIKNSPEMSLIIESHPKALLEILELSTTR
jgi:hypothetical protein